MLKLNNFTVFSVTATTETALNKLKKAEIPVKNCKKRGAEFIFSVKDEYRKKVFAIFASPCYNVIVKRESVLNRTCNLLRLRAGLVAGFVLFAIAAAVSNVYVLKITVSGSGAYLESRVRQIVYSAGFKEMSPYSRGDASLAAAQIMALPGVSFCSLSKSGSVLYVDVQTNSESGSAAEGGGLKSDVYGVVSAVVALCGTALVSEGDEVSPNTPLIGAYLQVNGENIPCLAVGYADIICTAETIYSADCESDYNLKLALSSCLGMSEEILTREYTVKNTAEGVNYIINFTYMHTISINLQ